MGLPHNPYVNHELFVKVYELMVLYIYDSFFHVFVVLVLRWFILEK